VTQQGVEGYYTGVVAWIVETDADPGTV